jgi:hypothetical protein
LPLEGADFLLILFYDPYDGDRTFCLNVSTFLPEYTAILSQRHVLFVVIKFFFFSIAIFAEAFM